MTIVASILCIAIVAVLHVTVVQKNPKLTNRVCITGANIILSLAFVILLYAINEVIVIQIVAIILFLIVKLAEAE